MLGNSRFIRASEDFGEDEVEVPLENDGTLLLTTLQSIFPGAKGLKFKNPLTNYYRVVKLDSELRFHAPGISEDDSWDSENINYICVFPKINVAVVEPKPTDEAESSEVNGVVQPKTVDLIILNLSPQTSEEELRGYFEAKYGPLLMAEIKRDRKTNASRRFAFIRFRNYKDQMKALGQMKHKIDGQLIRVALPDYRDPSELYQENKCFIGRVNEAIKANDLREFFSQFGEIVEVSYPKKFKGYAFITFADVEVAQKICGQDFVIKGFSVCVSKSTHGNSGNKQPPMGNLNQRFNGGGGFPNDWNNGWYSRDSWVGQGSSRDSWQPGSSSNYVTAPLNPTLDSSRNSSNFYGHTATLSSMGNSLLNQSHVNPLNVLQMAMGNLLNNSMGPTGNNFQRDRQQLWQPRHQGGSSESKAKKNNKKKTKNNPKNNPKNNKPKPDGDDAPTEDVKQETSESSPPAEPAAETAEKVEAAK